MRLTSLWVIALATSLLITGCQSAKSRGGDALSRDLVADLVRLNDENLSAQLERQLLDESRTNFGGIRAANGLYHAGTTAGFIRNVTAAYASPASRYFRSAELLIAMGHAVTFMQNAQHADGTIDLLTTNFHSPPDTAFVLEWMCSAAGVLRRADRAETRAVRARLMTFIERAAEALVVGGVHTPNHRWVVCMALARAHALAPNPRYVERIDTWLAEGIDIDPDGQFTERSTSIYSPLTDRCLITVARLLNRPALLEPVRRNLEMSLFYRHADGQVVTEGSRRQDQYRRSTMARYYYPYRYMALADGDQRFATIARDLELRERSRLAGQLIYFLESPELGDALPPSTSLPDDFERHFEHSKLVRIRRNELSATILADNSTFFSLHEGSASVVVRCASAFFGKGQFEGSSLKKEESAWVLRQELTGPYYQPIAPEHRASDGSWRAMDRALRPQSETQRLMSVVRIHERSDGFDVEFEITGTEGVPLAIELGCHPDTRLLGVTGGTEAGRWLPSEPELRLASGDDQIVVRGAQTAHEWTQIRGAEDKLPGESIYVTGFTPFHHTLELRR